MKNTNCEKNPRFRFLPLLAWIISINFFQSTKVDIYQKKTSNKENITKLHFFSLLYGISSMMSNTE